MQRDNNFNEFQSAEFDELAVYAVGGDIAVDGHPVDAGNMAVLQAHTSATIVASAQSKLMLLGGTTLEGERILWWNFIRSSRERLNQAKKDWLNRNFADVPGETEFIPLPKL